MANAPVVSIDNISLTYSTQSGPLHVLDGISMDIHKQGAVAVVGPSGCGKSSLTRLVSGLQKPDSGTISLMGKPLNSPSSKVGMAFQNPVLLEWRNILDNVMLPLEIVRGHGLSKAQGEERARELLSLVGLEGFENKRPSELSGGMRQRASLCRSLIHQPELLILDEPFGALDAFTREDLWVLMRQLRKTHEFTTLLITHDLREAVFLCDQVLVMSQRPAKIQATYNIDLGDTPSLDALYDPSVLETLKTLRKEIQTAQGRV